MDADGGRLRRLTENQGKNEDPCWSPDGRYIVFSSNRDGPYNLYIMTLLRPGENNNPSFVTSAQQYLKAVLQINL